MGEIRSIDVQKITAAGFASFGRVVGRIDERPPDTGGEGWACWCPVGVLHDAAPLEIGLVRTSQRPLLVKSMELHLDREEWVYALSQPVIQVVALSAADNTDLPDVKSARAFLIKPGQGVVIRPGVWHGVGLPAGDRDVVYGFVLSRSKAETQEAENPWVGFAHGAVVRVVADSLESRQR